MKGILSNNLLNIFSMRIIFIVLCLINYLYYLFDFVDFNSYYYIYCFLALIVFIYNSYKKKMDFKKNYLLVLLYLILCCSTFLFRKYVDGSIWFEISFYFLLFFIIYSPKPLNEKKIKKEILVLSIIISVVFFIISSISIYLYITKKVIWFNGYSFSSLNRLSGLYSGSTAAAIYAFTALMLSIIGRNLVNNNIAKNLFRTNEVVQVFLILISDCRSVKLTLVTILILYLVKKITLKKKIKLLISILIVLVSFFSIEAGFSKFNFYQTRNYDYLLEDNENQVINQFNEDHDLSKIESLINKLSTNRYVIWKEATLLSNDSILMGHGLNTLSHYGNYKLGNNSIIGSKGYYHTHNLIIQTLYAGGVLGSIILFYFFINCIKTIKEKLKNIDESFYSWLVLFLVGQLMISFFDITVLFAFRFTIPIFWSLLLFAVEYEKAVEIQ